ncbi:hypothetical protein [Streptomyces filamentosus]|uniref:hypothetical protein n=1 Tax=Streptomyces filamentosus TaxID=67294 RepID=UPI0033EF8687
MEAGLGSAFVAAGAVTLATAAFTGLWLTRSGAGSASGAGAGSETASKSGAGSGGGAPAPAPEAAGSRPVLESS